MPFFHMFRYKYEEKIYSTVQVRETNTVWHLREGEVISFFVQIAEIW